MSIMRNIRGYRRFLADKRAFIRSGGTVSRSYPVYNDYNGQAGIAKGHYFHQDLLVASFINKAKPSRHIDVGSSIEGFVSHVASFRDIEVFDIRPLAGVGHDQIKFRQADLMQLDEDLHGICDSLSCLHALEHFGLGRYGDPIDPLGHRKGFMNLYKMLRVHGILYISFPIGVPGVHFNAHRIFSPSEILDWIEDFFELQRFDYVDDSGEIHLNQNLPISETLSYGCGIYTLRKTR